VKGGILVTIEQLPLSKQVEIVFREIQDELFHYLRVLFLCKSEIMSSKIRCPTQSVGDKVGFQVNGNGLTETHLRSFRQMAIESLRHRQVGRTVKFV